MAIPFSGEFTTPASPEEVFDFLADPNKFAPLLPEFHSMTQEDATHFTVRLNVGFARIRGIAEIRMELREALQAERVVYHGQGNAMGNQIRLELGFDLWPALGSTRVSWRGALDISGKLALIAGAMLEPLAGKGMNKLMDGLKTILDKHVALEATTQAAADSDIAPPAAPTDPLQPLQTADTKAPEVSPANNEPPR